MTSRVGTQPVFSEVNALAMYVSVPVASFRNPHAREYLETYPCPPPSTVFGMLLSAVGETSRRTHLGTEIALAMLSEPGLSTVLRTKWRVKSARIPLGSGENRVPDFQEVLTDVRMAVWVRKSEEEIASPPLVELLEQTLLHGVSAKRFGALSLGESTHLVDDFRFWREEDGSVGRLLVRDDERGDLSLPIWADHVSSMRTRWGRYRLESREWRRGLPESAWVTIAPNR